MSAGELISLTNGTKIIEEAVKTLPKKPGVYQMLDKQEKPLYVGKAKNLRNRVPYYAQTTRLPNRLQRMVSQVQRVKITTTHTEADALLLEATLIKKERPKYNVLLKDSKSFPNIWVTKSDFPRILKHRGAQTEDGHYFGPFASTSAVNSALVSLQKIFQLRTCSDHDFSHRDRPCLQYHMKRCSAPCVGKISQEEYGKSVSLALNFFRGKYRKIQEELADSMEKASQIKAYEEAAVYRDRLSALSKIQSKQNVHLKNDDDLDTFALALQGTKICIQCTFFRAGNHCGDQSVFLTLPQGESLEATFQSFLAQFYVGRKIPPILLLNNSIEDKELLESAFSQQMKKSVTLLHPQRGDRKILLEQSKKNAEIALQRKFAERASWEENLDTLQHFLGLSSPINRLEAYDNSHTQGTYAIGAFIVGAPKGFEKRSYRKFNIRGRDIKHNDDYAMMREVFTRRFQGSLSSETRPDILLIDGGKGQLAAVQEAITPIFKKKNLSPPFLLAVAKGKDRNAGQEKLFVLPGVQIPLEHNTALLYFLQRIRDEVHRFAISSHQRRRETGMKRSILDDIPGLGPARKRQVLRHFGSAIAVSQAGIEDLKSVQGISGGLAQVIYDTFHEE